MSQRDRRPDLIVIPHRPGRAPRGLVLPMTALAIATTVLVLRAAAPDWRGLGEEVRSRLGSLVRRRAPAAVETPLARAKPVAPKAETPIKPPEPRKGDAPRVAEAPKAADAWDEIRKSAEKAEAERREAERIKEQAAEDLKNTPPPPPTFRRRMAVPNPARMAELERRQREMMARMAGMHARQFREIEALMRRQDEIGRRMMEDLAREPGPGGFAMPPPPGLFGPHLPLPGMDRMGGPLPGMDRLGGPLPGMERLGAPPWPAPGDGPGFGRPRIREESGEDVRNGVRRTWKRVVIIGG